MNQPTNLSDLETRLACLESELSWCDQICNEARAREATAIAEWADVYRRIRETKQSIEVEKLVAQRMKEIAQ